MLRERFGGLQSWRLEDSYSLFVSDSHCNYVNN